MASSFPNLPLAVVSLLLCLFSPTSILANNPVVQGPLTYHGGPLLTGQVNLALIWYGQFGRVQKSVVRSFIKSLNYDVDTGFEPRVSKWWNIVESYQSAANPGLRRPKIQVKVVRQVTDATFSAGKVLTRDFLPGLIQKATGGNPNTIAVIFASRQVTVEGTCMGACSTHGVIGKQVYIAVGNPEDECPGECAWPFHRSDYGPQGVTLQPPNGNVGADAMAMNFAAALAATVTNPYNTGFFKGPPAKAVEAAKACPGMFGSGAFPGYTGKVRLNPSNGGGFNAHGIKGKKFLLPGLWNPIRHSCWTII